MAERLSVIAGSGALVPEVIAAARGRGYAVQVLSLRGRSGLRDLPVVPFDLSDPMPALRAARDFGATIMTLAGAVTLSDRAREALARLAGAGPQSLGDTGLSALAGVLTEKTGARLVGVHEIAPDLLAPAGLIAGPAPASAVEEAAGLAVALARRAGGLDVGQAIVVSGRRVIAVEDIAGTDALLRRVRLYRRRGLVADGQSPLVFAKAAKPGQPHAVDLPAIGPVTVKLARAAGIAAVAVEAGATLLIDRERLAIAARAARLPVLGVVATDA